MNQMSKLDAFIQQAVTAMPISGTSLIASLYGDALLQRGGEVWLGSVAALLEGLGFGERFVRTALFRLNKEEWLDVVRIGRRSFYRLSDKGLRLTRRAEHKIYRASAPEWDGTGCCCFRKARRKMCSPTLKAAAVAGVWRAGAEPAGLAVAKAGRCPVSAPRSGRRRKRHLF